jgi:hypothetical protein
MTHIPQPFVESTDLPPCYAILAPPDTAAPTTSMPKPTVEQAHIIHVRSDHGQAAGVVHGGMHSGAPRPPR